MWILWRTVDYMAETLDLGLRVMTLRGRRTQAELARTAKIDKATLNRIETGKNANPSQATLEKLARALGISVAVLLDPDAQVVAGGHGPDVYLPDKLKLVLEDMEAQIQEAMAVAKDALAVGRAARTIAERVERQLQHRGRRNV
jgi:transcriptional regulator with XRE-family HTH domain